MFNRSEGHISKNPINRIILNHMLPRNETHMLKKNKNLVAFSDAYSLMHDGISSSHSLIQHLTYRTTGDISQCFSLEKYGI